MTDDYDELIEEINRTKNQVSTLNADTQKMVALYMWHYVRDHLDELHDMLTEEEIDSGDMVDYGYDAVERIKQDFCEQFEKDTGLVVNWNNYCILCHHYSNTGCSNPCANCPLGSCAAASENPYHTLVKYAFHKESKNSALSAIDTIIGAIKGAEL